MKPALSISVDLSAEGARAHPPRSIFQTFFQGGFECSTQKRIDGTRVDVVAASRHDRFAKQDYQRLRAFGIRTAREGLRWHLIEKAPGKYDFSTARHMIEAAQAAGVEVNWDLMHFGWPDHLDVFDTSFIGAFRDFSLATVDLLSRYRTAPIFVAPVNEISFLSWAAGDQGFFYPFARFRGRELKKQLAAAAIAASKAIRADFPSVRLLAPEPVIHIAAQPERPHDRARADRYRLSMFEAWDMLAGRLHPELGGDESCLDIIGVNYYDRNQWFHQGPAILLDDPHYRPFAEILKEVYARYQRPMLVSETGAEGDNRVPWFSYVHAQVAAARRAGVDLQGLCLYPIVNHPGWDDDRHCHNGLWDYASQAGAREICQPLALALHRHIFVPQTFMNIQAVHTFSKPDLLCFSHLRWNFVFQRPQHLMSRFGRERRVFYLEEPIFEGAATTPYWEERICAQSGVHILVPHLPEALRENSNLLLRQLLVELLETRKISRPLLWFYTAMALEFVPPEIEPSLMVYDCMDELSAFKNAPAAMRNNENRMFTLADLVFTGGFSLFEAKRDRHPRIFPFPSGVDVAHFSLARRWTGQADPRPDIPRPRIGFAGVIDERMDLPLLAEIARLRPLWQLVMVGPVVKIDPASLPAHPSIHWLGMRDYADLPELFAGWDVAIMPFALNESTRFISPTKTPEYLAAALPVVSTPIRDVVHPYGTMGLARIAAGAADFVQQIEEALLEGPSADRQKRADEFLETRSWEETWRRMNELIEMQATVPPPPPSALVLDQEVVHVDFLIVGAGFAGSVVAAQMSRLGKKVLLIDKRPHIAGNAYDHYDEHGILVHKYGPHIFHTNSRDVYDFLSQFTAWRHYEHRVLARVDRKLVPVPVNLTTVNSIYGLSLEAGQMESFLDSVVEHPDPIRTSEDVVVSRVGRDLYEKLFRGYTRKQWGLDPSELDASVTARIPVRTNFDDRYFTDTYQVMPANGYTHMFENMLDHPNISIELSTSYQDLDSSVRFKELVFTGPVDEYFQNCFGKLPYRCLEFEHQTLPLERLQPVGVINYPNDHAYTRVTEFKHLTGQRHSQTSVVYEYATAEGDPYYPVPRPENSLLYKQYEELAKACSGIHFVGRLATYKYYNMDQVVAQALTLCSKLTGVTRSELIHRPPAFAALASAEIRQAM